MGNRLGKDTGKCQGRVGAGQHQLWRHWGWLLERTLDLVKRKDCYIVLERGRGSRPCTLRCKWPKGSGCALSWDSGNELGVNTSQVAMASPLPPYSAANIDSWRFAVFWMLQCWLFSLLCLVALTLHSPRHPSGWEDLVLETRLFRKPWAGTKLDYLLLA